MKYFIKNKLIVIFAVLLALLGCGVSFLVFGISIWTNHTPFPYYFILIGFIFLYALLAYLVGDILIVKFKYTKKGEIDPDIPEDLAEKISKIRWTFALALILDLLVLAVFFIISLFGGWPLL